jgi:uncharacterized protein
LTGFLISCKFIHIFLVIPLPHRWEDILGDIEMAGVTKFDLMQIIGRQMAEFIVQSGNCFKNDLAFNNRDILVTELGDIARIQKQMGDPNWIDNFKA